MSDYWTSILDSRVSRRRGITAVAGAAAAFLAACGGSSDSKSTPKGPVDKSGLLSPRDEDIAKAVPGGVWPNDYGNNVQAIDPQANAASAAFALITPVYSTLVKYGKAVGALPGPETITGDAAESWEVSPDGLTVTFKLRANHTFDPRPPTSGRAMTTADVKYSFERTASISPVSGDLIKKQGSDGPVESLSTPDDKTIVLKLTQPYGPINEMLAYWYFYIVPTDAESKFNPKSDARGSGPYMLDEWKPSVSLTYKKNPNWYVKGRPLLDGLIHYPLSEPATRDAQFEAKAIWLSRLDMSADTLLRIKKDHPELVMRQQVKGAAPGSYPLLFGKRFQKDVRLRRAVSMLFDRDAFLDAAPAYNADVYRKVGLDVTTFWDGHLTSNGIAWLDPKAKELGTPSQWFQYNPTEAKKLMSAAGYTGDNVDFAYRANFGPQGVPDIVSGMIAAGGFKVTNKPVQENDWRSMKNSGGGNFDDFLWSTANSYNDDGYLATKYTPTGKDRVAPDEIPNITAQVNKIRLERDAKRRTEMIKQIQKDLADEMPDLPVVSTQPVLGYRLRWPWFRNDVYSAPGFSLDASTARPYTDYWYDATKKT